MWGEEAAGGDEAEVLVGELRVGGVELGQEGGEGSGGGVGEG